MIDNNSIKKILIVGISLCLVCSAIVSLAAINLRDKQIENALNEQKIKILASANLLSEEKTLEEVFSSIEERIVDLETGQFVNTINLETFDANKVAKDPKTSIVLSNDKDIALIKNRENYAKIYLHYNDVELNAVILPVRGYGLWGTMYGYLALESDLNTIIGLEFYKDKETPGLGAEINNPKWKKLWKGKEIYSTNGELAIQVIKGSVMTDDSGFNNKVDGLSGATITGNGVTNLLQFWLSDLGFQPFLNQLKNNKTLSMESGDV